MSNEPSKRRALVFGASGFIGRWLVRELLTQGVPVTAAVRSAASGEAVEQWLVGHDAGGSAAYVLVDFTRDGLGVDANTATLAGVSEIYNVAGAYRFGMSAAEARAANVEGAVRVVELAAQLPRVERLIHLSGYRVGAYAYGPQDWDEDKRGALYAAMGAYEASKVESDVAVRGRAAELGVPLTIANPSTVIGDSRTGETDQEVGLATSVRDLAAGKLMALPGGASTFVPIVSVDYLARFMALLPTVPEAAGQAYWILDDRTPALADLLTLIGRHLGVKVPKMRMPISLIRRLPAWITRADPETLGFLSIDRYPTGPARGLAQRHGLEFPPVEEVLVRWADYLVQSSDVLAAEPR
jgi:nucleoside-diphosphate-sugar epimerase